MTQLHNRFTDLGPLCSKQARIALESVEFIIALYPYCAMEIFLIYISTEEQWLSW